MSRGKEALLGSSELELNYPFTWLNLELEIELRMRKGRKETVSSLGPTCQPFWHYITLSSFLSFLCIVTACCKPRSCRLGSQGLGSVHQVHAQRRGQISLSLNSVPFDWVWMGLVHDEPMHWHIGAQRSIFMLQVHSSSVNSAVEPLTGWPKA